MILVVISTREDHQVRGGQQFSEIPMLFLADRLTSRPSRKTRATPRNGSLPVALDGSAAPIQHPLRNSENRCL